jgi:shikimate kinase
MVDVQVGKEVKVRSCCFRMTAYVVASGGGAIHTHATRAPSPTHHFLPHTHV